MKGQVIGRSNISRRKRIFGKKKGFTLVEVMVVVIIIGALSGILMISAITAMDRAEATRIVSDLKNIQSASVLYFADNSAWPVGEISVVNPYLSAKLDAGSNYSFEGGDASVIATYRNDGVSASVMKKLQEMQANGMPISVDVAGKSVAISIRG